MLRREGEVLRLGTAMTNSRRGGGETDPPSESAAPTPNRQARLACCRRSTAGLLAHEGDLLSEAAEQPTSIVPKVGDFFALAHALAMKLPPLGARVQD